MPDTSAEWLTFQKFNDPALAATISEQLRSKGIACEVVKEDAGFDVSFANNDFDSTIHLKLAPIDFNRAHTVLENIYKEQLAGMDRDYYLFSFTDAELQDIVQKPDEWGYLDHALAKQLLADRGQPLTPEQETAIKDQRIKELARPETAHPLLIIFGYLCAFTGGFPGLFLGYLLVYIKKTLPNGGKRYMYDLKSRWHGRNILILSAITFPLFLLLRFGHGLGFLWMGPL